MGGELVAGEQRVEYRRSDQVLGEHRNRIIASDGVVEVVAQALEKLVECRSNLEIGAI